ncbi:alkaline phosphatase family protein [Halovenus rubra]|uniref:Alkaline phosphatase family protein n=2 Tax=Halovenus rubra TaxID=869890 RepID=A0ACC7E1T0_9EURY|nr:alkaline phosphatase family protein [Halovenus rubra]
MGLFDRLRGDDQPRVAVVGIDGVPYSLLSQNSDEFETFGAIAEEGTAGAIDSIIPPDSNACWPALTTGVNPGETGVYGAIDREIDAYDTYIPMGRDTQATRLWTRVHDAGRQATVLNVPVTFPPDRDIQRMVSGFLSPGVDRAAYPDEIREYLTDIDYRIDVDAKLGHRDDKSAFLDDAHETMDKRFEAFEHYIELDDWDLFFGVFMTPDRVNHFLFEEYEHNGEGHEAFMDFYRKLDGYIGKLRAKLPDDVTLILVSDHGFTTLSHEVNCNEWLRETGWLDYRTETPDGLDDIGDETRAYSLIPGRFYLNLAGREPRGTIPETEYEATQAELKKALLEMTGPDGSSVIKRVETKESAFRGNHDEIAPDLVAIPHDGFDLKASFNGPDDVFTKTARNGMHTFEDASLFIDHPDAQIQDADLYDIAPTLLTLLDIDYDRGEFDGATLVRP